MKKAFPVVRWAGVCLLPGLFFLFAGLFSGCARPPARQAREIPTPPRAAEEIIKIGEYGSLTGPTATFGQSTKNGIDLAFREINAAGGLLGRRLEVIVEDDGGKTQQVQGVVKKLINRDQVLVILGEVASSRSLAGAPLCQAAGVPMVTPSSTNPAVTEKGDYVFRTCFTDIFQGKACAGFARQHLKAARAAIFKDIRNDYSKGLAQYFREYFEKMGGKIVSEQSYSEGDTDFRAQLITIKAANPQVLFIPGYYTDVGLIARQAKELALNCQLLGGDGWDGPELVQIGGEAIEGGYFTNHYSVDDPRPEVQRFVQAYKTEFGAIPDAMAALGYDAARIVAEAIKRAGRLDRKAIRDEIARTKDFKGVTGTITLDEHRNAKKPAVALQVRGGKWTYVTTIQP